MYSQHWQTGIVARLDKLFEKCAFVINSQAPQIHIVFMFHVHIANTNSLFIIGRRFKNSFDSIILKEDTHKKTTSTKIWLKSYKSYI
jgi:hypothetical protein